MDILLKQKLLLNIAALDKRNFYKLLNFTLPHLN